MKKFNYYILFPLILGLLYIICSYFWCNAVPRCYIVDETDHVCFLYVFLQGLADHNWRHVLAPDPRFHYPFFGYFALSLGSFFRPNSCNVWLPSAFIIAGLLSLFYLRAEKSREKSSVIIAAFLFVSPVFGGSMRAVMADNVFNLLATAAAIFLILSNHANVRKWAVLSGAAMALGLLCKIGVFLYLLVPVLSAVFFEEKDADLRFSPPKGERGKNVCYLLLIPAAVFLVYLCIAPGYFNAFLEAFDKNAPIPNNPLGESWNDLLWMLLGWTYGWGLLGAAVILIGGSLYYRIRSGASLRPWAQAACAVLFPIIAIPFLRTFPQTHYTLPILSFSIIWLSVCYEDCCRVFKPVLLKLFLTALAAALAVLWNVYPFFYGINYGENQIACCIGPLRIPKYSILRTSRTMYGLHIPYDERMNEIYEIVNLIRTEFEKSPVPDVKGAWYPFAVVGRFDYPMPLDAAALDTYMSTFGLFCKLKVLSVHDSPDYKYCRFFIGKEGDETPEAFKWTKIRDLNYKGLKVCVYERDE